MRRVVYGLAAAIMVAAIAVSSAGARSYRDLYVSFRYPDSWRVYHWSTPDAAARALSTRTAGSNTHCNGAGCIDHGTGYIDVVQRPSTHTNAAQQHEVGHELDPIGSWWDA